MELGSVTGSRRTVQQHVHEALRTAILTGRIAAGERLVLTDIAEQLKVSTTPVREALRELASAGLVKLDSHRGAVVTELTNEEVEEIYRIRQRLEPEVMSQAIPRLTEEHLREAESILGKAEVENDPSTWFDLNRQFHRVFILAAQSPRLESIVEALNDSAALYVVASWAQGAQTKSEADAQHRQIVQAARNRDVALAEALVVHHVKTTVAHLPNRLEGSTAVSS